MGIVKQVGRREVSLRIQERRQVPSPLWRVTLSLGIPKGNRMDQAIDQATQLGVSAVIPLITARGVVKIPPSGTGSKQARWRQIAVEAAKQCGVDRLPEIDPPIPWAELLRTLPSYDRVLIATVEGPHEPIRPLLSGGSARNLLLLIGPEGDFTPEEIQQAVQAGAHRIGLGPTVLRCETAAVVALGLLSFLLRKEGSAG